MRHGVICLAIVLVVSTIICRRVEASPTALTNTGVHQATPKPQEQNEITNKSTIRASSRSLMVEIARELISRTTGNSQVLSLSVTNLIILLVLKALLLGAGLFSYGAWRRSDDENSVKSFKVESGRAMSEGEILLLLSYLMGDTKGKGGYDCMYRVACEEPFKAKEYLSAARTLLKGAKMFRRMIPYNPKYEFVVYGLQEAVELGQEGKECSAKYRCSRD